jgi:hypothetical protein
MFKNVEKVFINLMLFAVIWLSFIYVGGPPASDHLDASWYQALGYLFKHHFQVGVDYIFSYGLLGYFFQPYTAYDTDLYHIVVGWWISYGFISAIVFLIIARRIPLVSEKFWYFASLIFIVSSASADAHYFLLIIAITLLIIEQTNSRSRFIFLVTPIAALILVILSLTKFTIFILTSFGVLSIAIIFWYRYSYRLALGFLGGYVVLFVGLWMLFDQSILNLPSFLAVSLALSRGYTDAMALTGNALEIYLALAAIAIIMVLTGLYHFKRWHLESLLSSLLIWLGLFLAWKAGFVRQDSGHLYVFYGFAILVPFLFRRDHFGKLRAVLFSLLLLVNVIICLIGIHIAGVSASSNLNLLGVWNQRVVAHTTRVSFLSWYKTQLDDMVKQLQKTYELPKTRAIVGQATIDIFSWEQGMVFLNGFNWHPRPLFQSYLAYTPTLISINSQFYASEQAPEFVLFKLQAIDGQFPWLNDSEALRILLRDYKPLFFEKEFLLLQHQAVDHEVAHSKPLITRTINFGERFVIKPFKDNDLVLKLEIEKSRLGKLISLFYKLPMIYLEIETTEGAQLNYKLIPGMAQSGFLINPLILNQSELMKWYAGESLPQVTTIRIVTSENGFTYFFKPTISLEVSHL